MDLPVDEEKLAPAIGDAGWTDAVILRNDTFAVSRRHDGAMGCRVVCGTGMNCAAVGPDGRTVRFPALAELSGDFAPGGAWLGLRALGLALRAGDARGATTSLSRLVPAHLRETDAEAVLTGIYTGAIPYARLFELARGLLDAVADGDAVAREAADMLADEVVAFVHAVVDRSACRTNPSRWCWAVASSTPGTRPSTAASLLASTGRARAVISSASMSRRCGRPRAGT